jgi:endonuclease/exonuclease/phosphatase family metal-dependent hydrolase
MNIRLYILTASFISLLATQAPSQIAISAGPYNQSFDSLATSGTANVWIDNVRLPGWYASKTLGGTTITTYRGDTGANNAGALYSFGVAGVSNLTDRALGSIASGTPGNFTYGIRFVNDTALVLTNITVSYTGEQWRSGTAATDQALAFSFGISSQPITNSFSAANWTNFGALNFVSPNLSAASSPLDGNAATNRQFFTTLLLTDVTLPPGNELMLRWSDINDTGEDNGLAIDDLVVTFNGGYSNPPSPPFILTQPTNQTAIAGDDVTFTVLATGNPPPTYQWQFNGTNLTGETNSHLVLFGASTNQAGDYRVVITNSVGSTNSALATLTVLPATFAETLSILTYNVKGNGATNWTTNSLQVQALTRQLQYLQPDVVTFNEIPVDHAYEMTNWISTFLPAYNLAVSSGNDGSICSAIVSRHTITRSNSWMARMDLRGFGYSNVNNNLDNFTRDLFEAEIDVPGFPQPVHIFTTHLKATESAMEYADNATKRAAEATAITNFLATNLAIPHPLRPYLLTGDMNDNDTNALAIQKLVSPATGLILTNPRNPVTSSINTYSTEFANPNSRLDYIFPNQLLFSNLRTSQVFRTDRLTPVPPNLNSNDCKVASDHLPVLMVFNNPYDKPFKLTSVTRTNPTVTLRWESVPGQPYRLEFSSNLATWGTLVNRLVAIGPSCTVNTNLNETHRFFRVFRLP